MSAAGIKTSYVRKIAYIALMAAVTAVLSQLSIPLPSGVPITMQTFAVALTGYMLGASGGISAIAVYIALGAVGLPVFASAKGGIASLTGYTGGFIAGFLPFALLCGLSAAICLSREMPKLRYILRMAAIIALSATGLAVCHLSGAAWFAYLSGNSLGASFTAVSLPYLLKDAVSVAAAYTVAAIIRKRIAVK